MFISEKNTHIKYIPATLCENKRWYISYSVINPADNKLKRITIKVNRVKKIIDRRRWAREIIHDINIKLSAGWNLLIEAECAKGYYKLIDVMDIFMITKQKELKPDSIRSYKSYIFIFKEYILK